MVDRILYLFLRFLLWLAGILPLRSVAKIGRAGGLLAYSADKRHRKMAIKNMTACFGDEKSEEEIRSLAKENFKRIGENFACAIKTMLMDESEIPAVLGMSGIEQFDHDAEKPCSRVFAIGHFGNFELYARCYDLPEGTQFATTYRATPSEPFEKILTELRSRTGCLYFERRRDVGKLKNAMQDGGIYLGLLSDQHATGRALRLPFFNRECSVSTAPAVFALRYDCPLHVTICYRESLARWRMEFSEAIPTHENGKARNTEDIVRDINAKFEEAIRRDPANWFWVHNRWKPAQPRARKAKGSR